MSSKEIFPPVPYYNTLPGTPDLCLWSGAKYVGVKRWTKGQQDLEVVLQNVDRDNDLVYGLLTMRSRKYDNPTKVTYFEGEIIGKKHSFLTRKWFANSEVDRTHWWKFDCFYKYATIFTNDQFDYGCLLGNDHIYMRWKECPCNRNIGFVSPGFYYVCLTKSTGIVEGIYYERDCEEWNEDTFYLKHIHEKSLPVYQFR